MHTPGIIGLPRRIFDYPTVYFRFHRLQSFGIIGIALPSAVSVAIIVLITEDYRRKATSIAMFILNISSLLSYNWIGKDYV